MTDLAKMDVNLDQVFGSGKQQKEMNFNYIKTKKGKFVVVTKDEDGNNTETDYDELKVRVLFKTATYQHTFSDGTAFNVLGSSHEHIEGQPFAFFKRNEDDSYIRHGGLKNKRDVTGITGGLMSGEKIDFQYCLYVETEDHGICRMFLKRTQTIGMEKTPNGFSYKFNAPMKDGLADTEAKLAGSIKDYEITLTTDTYELGTTTITYPIFSDRKKKIDKEYDEKLAGILKIIAEETQAKYDKSEESDSVEKKDDVDAFDSIMQEGESKKTKALEADDDGEPLPF